MKRYNILNNSLGWLCFIIAAVTYLLTLEPTASFWDCPEFILQAFKLEVGHPPGNPIFMLAGRFFVNLAGGDVTKVAWCVNAMSGLLSAGTILLLFWTITHLVKKLIVPAEATEVSPLKMALIFGSGICGALMYAWSDTFWFSAVEGEVYAFSSFCTALVFWLILKWENRADRLYSDKYLILIAYVIGISIAVHLLNLLCIPAIVLVVYYKKSRNATAKGSLLALLVSFVIVGLILYGLVPGFINVAQTVELFCVNTLGMSFNAGVLIYTILTIASFSWTLRCLYRYHTVSPWVLKASFLLSIILSGILFIGDGLLIGFILLAALVIYLFKTRRLPLRVLTLTTLSILVIFIGYSSYALLLIRSSAHTPMNQNAPDNVFALSSYLNREQYGERPLIYGKTVNFYTADNGQPASRNDYVYIDRGADNFEMKKTRGIEEFAREIKSSLDQPDRYHSLGKKERPVTAPEMNMLFPRMYESSKVSSYSSWIGGLEGTGIDATILEDEAGNPLRTVPMRKATIGENLKFFLVYQLNHMYWRYFMWNFAGRQNDIMGYGEPTHGNWISGIPFIDNPRLGDQSLLPDDLGKDNAGHNVFYMLPLIMGLIGLFWQASAGKKGIEQFWVVFFLFFMTGIAIVLYLNQIPDQPRERDYAFAGSFYAYAIWVGMGVAGLWHYIVKFLRKKTGAATGDEKPAFSDLEEYPAGNPNRRLAIAAACVAVAIGLFVPAQVVSQTWDDHDRSGRTAARDFGMNYLNSLDPDAIIFTYGDNDTFPLWYAQEVEGVRTDVKVINLSYFTTDWYINQQRRQSYDAAPIDLQATPDVYGYDQTAFWGFHGSRADTMVNLTDALAQAYTKAEIDPIYNAPLMKYPNFRIPANGEAAVASGRIRPDQPVDDIQLNLARQMGGIGVNHLMVLDLLNQSAANGWKRPVYFATTVPSDNYIGLQPFFSQTGLAYEVVPSRSPAGNDPTINTGKMYRNITERWRWGGLDKATTSSDIYLDETVRRMVSSNRSAMFDLTKALLMEGIQGMQAADSTAEALVAAQARADLSLNRADTILALQKEKLSEQVMPYTLFEVIDLTEIYQMFYLLSGDEKYLDDVLAMLEPQIMRYSQYIRYYNSLSPLLRSLRSNHDRVVEYYYPALLERYVAFGGDIETLSKQVSQENPGVDIVRILQQATRPQSDEETAE